MVKVGKVAGRLHPIPWFLHCLNLPCKKATFTHDFIGGIVCSFSLRLGSVLSIVRFVCEWSNIYLVGATSVVCCVLSVEHVLKYQVR